MKGMNCCELGHPNYQHPQRQACHFGPYLDNFSAWVIYASIVAVTHDRSLWKQLKGGDDCLLFKKSDFANPATSAAFAALDKSDNATVRQLSSFLKLQLMHRVESVPPLQSPLPNFDETLVVRSEIHCGGTRTEPEPSYSHDELNELILRRSRRLDSPPIEQIVQRKKMLLGPKSHSLPGGISARRTSWQGLPLKRNPLFWQGILSISLALLIGPSIFSLLTTSDALLHEGKTYLGEITHAEVYTPSSSRYSHYSPRLYVTYNYTVNGKQFAGADELQASLEPYIRKGTKIEVVALPSKPEDHEPVLAPAGTTRTSDLRIINAFLTLAFIFQVVIWLPTMVDWLLITFGSETVGRVRSFSSSGRENDSNHYVRIEYEVNNKTYQQSRLISADIFLGLRRGMPLKIFYHPRIPKLAVAEIASAFQVF